MKHESLNVKKFTVKEDKAFRVRVEAWESISPKELLALDVIQECLNDNGEVNFTSTYNFHMTKEEIQSFAKGLLSV
jgi:trehalose/maltose hydrolase-like predicted phosphorylase